MSTLKERCSAILKQITKDAILRQGSSVETLMEFVIAETGRRADPRLEPTLPLVLYFGNAKDRDDFIEEVCRVKTNMIARKMP